MYGTRLRHAGDPESASSLTRGPEFLGKTGVAASAPRLRECVAAMSTPQSNLRQFSNYEAPTNRFAQLAVNVNAPQRPRKTVKLARAQMPASPASGGPTPPKKEASSSGVRPKVAAPSCDQLERMASFVTMYTSVRRELESVLDFSRVLVLTGRVPEELDANDPDLTSMLRLVNGVSSVEDVIESSGLERTHAVSVLCTLVVARTITFV